MIILKPTLSFFLLLVLARILGKKQMSQMTFFNYVTGITIGTLAANIISTDASSSIEDAVGLIWWCFLTGVLAFITLKSKKLRLLIDGQPDILVKNGIFQKNSLKKARVSIEELSMMLREQNVFSIEEVDYAILEPNGRLSVLKNQDYLNVIRSDLQIDTVKPKYLPAQVIMEGEIIYHNIKELEISIEWLEKELKDKQIEHIKDVFYAEIQSDGSLFTILNNKVKDKR